MVKRRLFERMHSTLIMFEISRQILLGLDFVHGVPGKEWMMLTYNRAAAGQYIILHGL